MYNFAYSIKVGDCLERTLYAGKSKQHYVVIDVTNEEDLCGFTRVYLLNVLTLEKSNAWWSVIPESWALIT